MSYEQFADDAAALLRALKVERADVTGESKVLVPIVTAFLDDVPPVTPELF